MDTLLSDVLKEICKEFGCDESFSQLALKTLKDIKNINFDNWRFLNLPLNLYYILNERIKNVESGLKLNPFLDTTTTKSVLKTQITSSITNHVPHEAQEKILTLSNSNLPTGKNSENLNNVCIQQPQQIHINEHEIDPEKLLKADIYKILENILIEINDKEISKEVLKKVHLIIMNIISNPKEEKFRKINTESKFYISLSAYKNFKKFLEFIQFEKMRDSNYLVYKGDEDFIIKVGDNFNQFLLDKKIAESSFNPYATSFIGLQKDLDKLKGNKAFEQPDFDELLKNEKERREEIIKGAKQVPREAKIFLLKSADNLNELIENLNEVEKNFQSEKKIEEADFYKYAMNVIRSNTDKFVVKRRTEFENLIKKPIYDKATIRIKFPNETLMQANFAMMETVGDIHKFVREHLNDPSLEFSLFTPYPRKAYNDMKATVYSQGLAPNTLLYISFPGVDPRMFDYNYLKQSSVERFQTEIKQLG